MSTEQIKLTPSDREQMARDAMLGKEVIPPSASPEPVVESVENAEVAAENTVSEDVLPAAEASDHVKNGAERLEELMNDPDFRKAFEDKVRSLSDERRTEKESTVPRERLALLRSREAAKRIKADAESVKAVYPGFDLRSALSDIRIRSMLKSGIPLKAAYEAANIDRIFAEREKAVVENIRTRASRPAEGGASSQSGAVTGTSVSRLTRDEREKLAQRAIRGEEITFR